MFLGAQIAGSAMVGTAGYCAEILVAGEQWSLEGMAMAVASGAVGAIVGAVLSEVAPKVSSIISIAVSKSNTPYSNLGVE